MEKSNKELFRQFLEVSRYIDSLEDAYRQLSNDVARGNLEFLEELTEPTSPETRTPTERPSDDPGEP